MWIICVIVSMWIQMSQSHDMQAQFKCSGALPTDEAGLIQHAKLLGDCARGKTAACDALASCENKLLCKQIISLLPFLLVTCYISLCSGHGEGGYLEMLGVIRLFT